METFPPNLQASDGKRPAALICPDCGGVVSVHARGRELLVFECRVGHQYSTEEVIIGKEAHIENVMWAAVYAYQELADFLRTLRERRTARVSGEELARRAEQAEANANALRGVIERDRRLSLPDFDGGASSETIVP